MDDGPSERPLLSKAFDSDVPAKLKGAVERPVLSSNPPLKTNEEEFSGAESRPPINKPASLWCGVLFLNKICKLR